MATLASKGSVTVTLTPGQTLNVEPGGQGVAVLKGGPFKGQSFGLGSEARKIGPFGFDMPITINSQSGALTYYVAYDSEAPYLNIEGEYDRISGLPELDTASMAALGKSTATYFAPSPTGDDDTTLFQQFIDDTASTEAANIAAGRYPLLIFNGPITANGLVLAQGMRYQGRGCKITKASHGSGTFDSATQAVLRTKLLQASGSWYGQADNIEVSDFVIDQNDKVCQAGIVNFFNVRNFRKIGRAHV